VDCWRWIKITSNNLWLIVKHGSPLKYLDTRGITLTIFSKILNTLNHSSSSSKSYENRKIEYFVLRTPTILAYITRQKLSIFCLIGYKSNSLKILQKVHENPWRKKIQTSKSLITEVVTLTNKHKFHFLNITLMKTRDKRDQRELESSAEDRFLWGEY
jgi:hypothetical protein